MDADESFTVTYFGQVYNIYNFLKIHPGGTNYLKPYKNKEIAKKMKETNHSTSAYHFLQQYKTEKCGTKSESDLDALVDLDKPLLSQIPNLGERYNEWVMLPVSRRLRFFESDFLEHLSLTPWFVVPAIWIPVVICLIFYGTKLYTAMTPDSLPFFPVTFHFISGIIMWTMLEYTLHRWIFHIKPSGKSKAMMYIHFLLHGQHHKAPCDVYRLVFPPLPAAGIALMFYLILVIFLTESVRILLTAGLITGYLTHDMTHFCLHFGAPAENTYFYYLKRYHLKHHFVNPDSGFGIITDFWDKICGSIIAMDKLSKNIKW